jgi:hypothetical protein
VIPQEDPVEGLAEGLSSRLKGISRDSKRIRFDLLTDPCV